MELCLGTALQDAAAAPAAPPALRYAAALSGGGVSNFVENVSVEIGALIDEDAVIPIIIGDGAKPQSYVASLYAIYVQGGIDELLQPENDVLLRSLAPAVRLGGSALRFAQIDRAVDINNWLLPTNPGMAMNQQSLARLKKILIDRFPDHYVCVRGLNKIYDATLIDALSEAGFTLLPARPTYNLDPTTPGWRGTYRLRRDLKFVDNLPGYRLVSHHDIKDDDYARMAGLYHLLYVERHSDLSPRLTEAFFRCCHREQIVRFQGLRGEDGRLAGFIAVDDKKNALRLVLIGYDTNIDRSARLYPTLFAIYVDESRQASKPAILGYGVGRFKRMRGGEQTIDYNAIYCRHLPASRRLVVGALRWALDGLGLPLLKQLGE